VVLFAKRPLLLVPAKLRGKTERDRRLLAEHWELPEFLEVWSYEWLGTVGGADALEQFAPDAIIMDEAHKLRNLRAARTRRVRRFFTAHPEVKCVPMSGTMTNRSLHDYAHIAQWGLKKNAPVPLSFQDLELWADALDARKDQTVRAAPNALRVLCNAEEQELWKADETAAARAAFRRRLIETPGVVASHETGIDATLTIEAVEPPESTAVDEAFNTLRKRWETPDGWPIADGPTMRRHAFELALSMYYVWRPRPPRYWLDARREWCAFVRETLKHSHKLDSAKQVALANPEAPEYLAWKKVEKDFEPNTVAVWIDDTVLDFCAEWAEKERGIVWTNHVLFARRLEEKHGITYYGEEGFSSAGKFIDDHPPGTPLAASIPANNEGRNLQTSWSSNLITAPPANGLGWEQLLSRTHREGQEADEVSVDLLFGCYEHAAALWQAVEDSEYAEGSMGAPRKLLMAGINVPLMWELMRRQGPRWSKTFRSL
jgi:hypothetical protein